MTRSIGSADGLSLVFLIIWLAGDVFNILGGVLQGVIPTVVILAIYYTLADVVLLCQVFYYRWLTLKEDIKPQLPSIAEPTETQALLGPPAQPRPREDSAHSIITTYLHSDIDAAKLSPATPFLPPSDYSDATEDTSTSHSNAKAFVLNTFSVLLVVLAGVSGWFLTQSSSKPELIPASKDPALQFNTLGQIFGYLCAILYLGSRIPQILLNYRRKSCEGVSLLFFLFACLGNLTFVLSILAYEVVCKRPECRPGEARSIYMRYFAVNFSWLLGSFGTLCLDLIIFAQFFLYKGQAPLFKAVDDT